MKKKNPSKIMCTQADLDRAQRKIDREIAKMKQDSAMDATKVVQMLFFYQLHESFGFTQDDIAKLQADVDSTSNRIRDPQDDFSFDDITAAMEAIDVYFDYEGE